MQVVRLNVGPLDNNTYVVMDEAIGEGVVVDPSFESMAALERWSQTYPPPPGVTPAIRWIIDTHAHLDHTAENAAVAERTGARLAMHAADLDLYRATDEQAAWFGIKPPPAVEVSRLLRDGEEFEVGQGALRVLHTPGHSPGGICLLGDGWVLTGDTLFADSVGRTDLPGGSMPQLLQSIRERLLTLPDETRVYPGHGPETTIGRERVHNPFLIGLEAPE